MFDILVKLPPKNDSRSISLFPVCWIFFRRRCSGTIIFALKLTQEFQFQFYATNSIHLLIYLFLIHFLFFEFGHLVRFVVRVFRFDELTCLTEQTFAMNSRQREKIQNSMPTYHLASAVEYRVAVNFPDCICQRASSTDLICLHASA